MGLTRVSWDETAFQAKLEQVGAKAVKRGIDQMRLIATDIQDIAREFAPIDEGCLRAAIQTKDVSGGRSVNGQFLRTTVKVYVNPQMPGSGGMAVGDYAYLMHEGLAPYGDNTYHLGPGSAAADGGRGIVGGRFLTRAVEFYRLGFELRMIKAIKEGLHES